MQYRKLGKTGLKVSAVSMGCWGISGDWGAISDEQAESTIKAAKGSGINLFDTADAYGLGRSEELLGKFLPKEGHYVATKVGNFARRAGHPLSYATPHHIYLCCEASLRRLKRDVIDIYQCHIAMPQQPEIFLEAFETLIKQGKIRSFGISTDSVQALERFNAAKNCSVCQLRYNIIEKSTEQEILPYCQKNDIGVLVRSPLATSILTGKYDETSTFQTGPRRDWNGEKRSFYLDRIKYVEKLKKLERSDFTLPQIALQFVLNHPAVTTAIPGMKNPDQARMNAAAADKSLTSQELADIRQM